jgi:hypothetical protein
MADDSNVAEMAVHYAVVQGFNRHSAAVRDLNRRCRLGRHGWDGWRGRRRACVAEIEALLPQTLNHLVQSSVSL